MNVIDALETLPVEPKTFRLNRSIDSRWVTDGHVAFRRSTAIDAKLLDRIAKVSKPSKLQGERIVDDETVERLFLRCSSVARHDISLAALSHAPIGNAKHGIARFSGPLPGPVIDVDIALLRLVLAVIGPWDRVTTVSWKEPIVFWRQGTAAAILAAFGGSDLDEPLSAVFAGRDIRLPRMLAAWKPKWPKLPAGKQEKAEVEDLDAHWRWISAALEQTAVFLGGAPSAVPGYAWAIPTRAGILRVGLDEKHLIGRFDEPLKTRSLRVSYLSDLCDFPSGRLQPDSRRGMIEELRKTFDNFGLALPPDSRPSLASLREAMPILFDARYRNEGCDVPYGDWRGYAIRDQLTGQRLRGAYTNEDAAAEAAERLSIAATLASETR